MNIFLVSLGCDKNLVDSQVMLGILQDNGHIIVQEESQAEIIIVNTCAFIHDAKEESIETILEMASYKEIGKCQALIVSGCLTQRYQDELKKELPEVDAILGASNYDDILEVIDSCIDRKPKDIFRSIDHQPDVYINRTLSQTTAYGYLKIAEGCDNHCTYCIIPSLRGKYRSREFESLIEEAKYLVSSGKKELILVAQDLAKYGLDLYGERKLPELLRALCQIEELQWIRLLYCYPEDITDNLIEVIKTEDKVLNYLDIPLQHISDHVLKRMARHSNQKSIEATIKKLRNHIPDICIRTTFIVGFPGETEEDYRILKDFIKRSKLDRVGVFTYSLEEDTPAEKLEPKIEQSVMEARRDELMMIQQAISSDKNIEMIGKTIPVIIEGYMSKEDVYIGRSYKDAPDIDGYVFVSVNYQPMLGDIVEVEITSANEYDLIGEIKDEPTE